MGASTNAATTPCLAADDPEWLVELHNVEVAVTALLEVKRKMLRKDPVREQVLWMRHADRLKKVKRLLDAAVL